MTTTVSGSQITFNDNSTQNTAAKVGMVNRIINGAMVIDQRNAGSSVTPTNAQYLVDRWQAVLSQNSKFSAQQNAGSVTPPTGFKNYLGITSLSSYTVGASELFNLVQSIEGYNIADLGWGASGAASIAISFWVRSSLTGTFGAVINNNAATRFYGFTYTISSANTWEYKTVTIAGDTTGTWATDNTTGIALRFGLGVGTSVSGTAGSWGGTTMWGVTGATSVVGTNGATLYITGVQLEKGSTATSFDYRPYGTELQLCQRYYNPNTYGTTGFAYNTTTGVMNFNLGVSMRTAPTLVYTSGSSTSIDFVGGVQTGITLSASSYVTNNTALYSVLGMSGRTTWQGIILANNNNVAFSAEL